MRRRIAVTQRPIACFAKYFALVHDNAANRHFACFRSKLGLGKSNAHEVGCRQFRLQTYLVVAESEFARSIMTRKSSDITNPDRERIAKVIARAGLASRRETEAWIVAGRVKVNGEVLKTPATTVSPNDKIEVDGTPLPTRERTRLFLYNKPRGLVTTNSDPEGRPTIFQNMPNDLPRVVSVGRLDINSEGLLLLTNDGGLSRILELPSTGWLRRYRVRANGRTDQQRLNSLKKGITVEGVVYGTIEATLDSEKGANQWLTIGIREGKNREVRKVLEHIGLKVNRLIRVSFGPFELGEIKEGAVEEVPTGVLREQIGGELEKLSQSDFDAPVREAVRPVIREKPLQDHYAKPDVRREERPGKSGRDRPRKFGDKRDTRPGDRPAKFERDKPRKFGDKRDTRRDDRPAKFERDKPRKFEGKDKPRSDKPQATSEREGKKNIRRGGKRTPFRAPKSKR
jgi:23S rRNA pseudouridine2605 synthase